MSLEQQPPEQADGGYWYPVEAITDEEGNTPGTLTGTFGWAAWYATINETLYAAVRTPEPLSGIETTDAVTVTEILSVSGLSSKPRARIKGE